MKEQAGQYPDEEIIRRILAGETGLFEILIRRNNAVLYKTGRGYNYNHEDTQDLMQDTFIDAFRHLAGFENRSGFRTWITRIMLNNCFRKKQKSSYKNERPADINEKSAPMHHNGSNNDSHTLILNRELRMVIEKAIREIGHDYRMVFSLRELNGFSVEETAELLGISPANVKTRLNRAKAMLRKEIENYYQAEEIFEFNLIYCDAVVNNVMARIQNLQHTRD